VWPWVFANWHRYVCPDLREYFGIEPDDELRTRSWRWFHRYISALLDIPTSRLSRGLNQ